MIATLNDIKTGLLITSSADDTLLTRLLEGADGFIAQHTGRNFSGGTFTELHTAGRNTVFLRNYPVTDVTSVKVDPARQFGSDTRRAADTYVVHADRGVIESLTGPFLIPRNRDDWPGALQVVYTTATNAVPTAVREAVTQLVGHWYRQVKTFAAQDYQMLIEQLSGTDAQAWSWNLTTGLTIPPIVLQLLALYRVPST